MAEEVTQLELDHKAVLNKEREIWAKRARLSVERVIEIAERLQYVRNNVKQETGAWTRWCREVMKRSPQWAAGYFAASKRSGEWLKQIEEDNDACFSLRVVDLAYAVTRVEPGGKDEGDDMKVRRRRPNNYAELYSELASAGFTVRRINVEGLENLRIYGHGTWRSVFIKSPGDTYEDHRDLTDEQLAMVAESGEELGGRFVKVTTLDEVNDLIEQMGNETRSPVQTAVTH